MSDMHPRRSRVAITLKKKEGGRVDAVRIELNGGVLPGVIGYEVEHDINMAMPIVTLKLRCENVSIRLDETDAP